LFEKEVLLASVHFTKKTVGVLSKHKSGADIVVNIGNSDGKVTVLHMMQLNFFNNNIDIINRHDVYLYK